MKILLFYFSKNMDVVGIIKGIWEVVFIEQLRQPGLFSQTLRPFLV